MVDANVFLKPDKTLASLETKLRTATGNAAIEIQKQIDARQAELTAEYGSVGFGSGGYVIPNYAYSENSGAQYGDLLTKQNATQAALAGKMQLTPTGSTYNDPVTGQTINLNPIYQGQYYGPQGQTGFVKDPETGELVDQYEYGNKVTQAQLAGKMPKGANLKTFYDENGNQLSADAVARTTQGAAFARKGWDIGFGPGMLANGVDATQLSEDQFRSGIVNNLVASGEMAVAGYNPVTGVIASNTDSTVSTVSSTANNAINAALQLQIDNLKEQGRIAEAKRLEDKARFDAEIKAQAAASKLAYDTAAQDKADAIKVERISAYQTLKNEFDKYGLGSLAESVEALILNGTPKSEATLKLRATPQYQLRFAGNKIRLAEGKNLYDESTYLALENDFQTSFEAYGQKALLGNTRESAQAMFAEYIGSDKSPTEIKDRIRLAVDEVNNRKDIRAEFQKFFPEITDSDLVSYFLKPKETLSALTAKVRVAQIGSAASAQGLNASLSTATDLEQLGLTEQQARTGYQRVATDLPAIEKLGDIDKTNISQTTAENAYLKGLASEQRKIDQAAQRERNRFAQSSGMNKVSLTDAKAAGQY